MMGAAKETLRIAFCAYDRPNHVAGGPNNWARRLLPDLRARGMDVRPLIMYSGERTACPLIEWLSDAGFPVACISREQLKTTEDQVRWLLDQAEVIQPDVFVANLVAPAFYAARWIREAGIPTVGVFHSSRDFCDAMTSRFVAGHKRDAFTAAVCVSDAIRSIVGRTNPNGVEIVRIPCGAPFSETQKTFDTRTLRVLYVGRIAHEAKRAVDVGKAFCLAASEIADATFTMVGAGPDENELTEIISSSGMARAVRFIGAVNPDELPEIYQSHDVIVLLSDYEGLPVAMVEGMAHGLVPIALSTIGGIDELVEDGVNGMLIENRASAFVWAIKELRSQPDKLRQLSIAARTTVEKEYSSAVTHERWSELLSRLASHRGKKHFRAPFLIPLPHPEPAFGSEDQRRARPLSRVTQLVARKWFRLRQDIRPRSRLRAMLFRDSQ
jgi:glycosyltransferase involved in cell wall biosynthesis